MVPSRVLASLICLPVVTRLFALPDLKISLAPNIPYYFKDRSDSLNRLVTWRSEYNYGLNGVKGAI